MAHGWRVTLIAFGVEVEGLSLACSRVECNLNAVIAPSKQILLKERDKVLSLKREHLLKTSGVIHLIV